jgi:hypothetical protein
MICVRKVGDLYTGDFARKCDFSIYMELVNLIPEHVIHSYTQNGMIMGKHYSIIFFSESCGMKIYLGKLREIIVTN